MKYSVYSMNMKHEYLKNLHEQQIKCDLPQLHINCGQLGNDWRRNNYWFKLISF